MTVFYFTAELYALSNIALRRIKVSRYSELNDPFELIGADLGNATFRKWFGGERKKLDDQEGLICFSRSWKSPLLWGHYGDKHRGIALGFEIPEERLIKVNYTSTRELLGKEAASGFSAEVFERLKATKFEEWKYEDEFRLPISLSTAAKDGGLYFRDFDEDIRLTTIILGPACTLPIEKVQRLAKLNGDEVRVIKSRLAFRSFSVIEDQRKAKYTNKKRKGVRVVYVARARGTCQRL